MKVNSLYKYLCINLSILWCWYKRNIGFRGYTEDDGCCVNGIFSEYEREGSKMCVQYIFTQLISSTGSCALLVYNHIPKWTGQLGKISSRVTFIMSSVCTYVYTCIMQKFVCTPYMYTYIYTCLMMKSQEANGKCVAVYILPSTQRPSW